MCFSSLLGSWYAPSLFNAEFWPQLPGRISLAALPVCMHRLRLYRLVSIHRDEFTSLSLYVYTSPTYGFNNGTYCFIHVFLGILGTLIIFVLRPCRQTVFFYYYPCGAIFAILCPVSVLLLDVACYFGSNCWICSLNTLHSDLCQCFFVPMRSLHHVLRDNAMFTIDD